MSFPQGNSLGQAPGEKNVMGKQTPARLISFSFQLSIHTRFPTTVLENVFLSTGTDSDWVKTVILMRNEAPRWTKNSLICNGTQRWFFLKSIFKRKESTVKPPENKEDFAMMLCYLHANYYKVQTMRTGTSLQPMGKRKGAWKERGVISSSTQDGKAKGSISSPKWNVS